MSAHREVDVADLESLVATAVHGARVMERALHDPCDWTMCFGREVSMVAPTRHSAGVRFVGRFPNDSTSAHSGIVELYHRGELLGVRPFEVPRSFTATDVIVEWDLSVRQ